MTGFSYEYPPLVRQAFVPVHEVPEVTFSDVVEVPGVLPVFGPSGLPFFGGHLFVGFVLGLLVTVHAFDSTDPGGVAFVGSHRRVPLQVLSGFEEGVVSNAVEAGADVLEGIVGEGCFFLVRFRCVDESPDGWVGQLLEAVEAEGAGLVRVGAVPVVVTFEGFDVMPGAGKAGVEFVTAGALSGGHVEVEGTVCEAPGEPVDLDDVGIPAVAGVDGDGTVFLEGHGTGVGDPYVTGDGFEVGFDLDGRRH